MVLAATPRAWAGGGASDRRARVRPDPRPIAGTFASIQSRVDPARSGVADGEDLLTGRPIAEARTSSSTGRDSCWQLGAWPRARRAYTELGGAEAFRPMQSSRWSFDARALAVGVGHCRKQTDELRRSAVGEPRPSTFTFAVGRRDWGRIDACNHGQRIWHGTRTHRGARPAAGTGAGVDQDQGRGDQPDGSGDRRRRVEGSHAGELPARPRLRSRGCHQRRRRGRRQVSARRGECSASC